MMRVKEAFELGRETVKRRGLLKPLSTKEADQLLRYGFDIETCQVPGLVSAVIRGSEVECKFVKRQPLIAIGR